MSRGRKSPLYRRVNTRTHGVRHGIGGDYRHDRNTRAEAARAGTRGKMRSGLRHGLDYTPLFRFLISKVGQDWDAIHAEAVSRLDREDPVWWLVARPGTEPHPIVTLGESSHWSGLFIDDGNRLAVTDPSIDAATLEPGCACCTHTMNGIVLTRPYRDG